MANGLWPMPKKTPANAVIHGKIDRGAYTVDPRRVEDVHYRLEAERGYPHRSDHWSPGVFRGDLSFYTKDDSLTGRLGMIDTRKTPVHIMCGEYDLTCTPEDARRTAEAIDGATLAIMKDLGHFPMSENPPRFIEYLLPVLEKIRR